MEKKLILFLVSLTVWGCQNPLESETDIRLYVTEIAAPANAPSTGRMTITFTVQTGGCKRFDSFEVSRTPARLVVEARGTDKPRAVCTGDIRYEPHSYEVQGPFTDPYTITATQPDGGAVNRVVRIQ